MKIKTGLNAASKTRQSSDSVWPLRRADGSKWSDHKPRAASQRDRVAV